MNEVRLERRVAAEFIGTFALVLAGAGAIVIDDAQHGAITHVGIAATFGLVIMVMIFAVGHISGAHFNPGVTLAFAVARHFPARTVIPYWLAQFSAAVMAAVVLRLMFGNVPHLGATIPSGSDAPSFWLEAILTFFLAFVIVAVATDTGRRPGGSDRDRGNGGPGGDVRRSRLRCVDELRPFSWTRAGQR